MSVSVGLSLFFGGVKFVDVKYVEDKSREAILIRLEENFECIECK